MPLLIEDFVLSFCCKNTLCKSFYDSNFTIKILKKRGGAEKSDGKKSNCTFFKLKLMNTLSNCSGSILKANSIDF